MIVTRRALIGGLASTAGALVAGCDAIGDSATGKAILFSGDGFQRRLQRALTDRTALAKEFRPDQRSPVFRSNGTRDPGTPDYAAAAAGAFADWRVAVDGLVARPLSLTIADLRAMPLRRQITRHDCVEGWSAIGEWIGPQLGPILRRAGVRDAARYLVFHCVDRMGRAQTPYYESIDLVDAFHPQTILALGLNGAPLDVAHGAPVRLRVEKHLGYKHAKYVRRIEAVAGLATVYGGRGGYWEDVAGYDWYAGI